MTTGYKTGYGGNAAAPLDLDELFAPGTTPTPSGYKLADGTTDLSDVFAPVDAGSPIGFDTGFKGLNGADLTAWFAAIGSLTSILSKGTLLVGMYYNGDGANPERYYGVTKASTGQPVTGNYTASEGADVPGFLGWTESTVSGIYGTYLQVDAANLPDYVKVTAMRGTNLNTVLYAPFQVNLTKFASPELPWSQYKDVNPTLMGFESFNGGSMLITIDKLVPSHVMVEGSGTLSGNAAFGYNDGVALAGAFGSLTPAEIIPGNPIRYFVGLTVNPQTRLKLGVALNPDVVDYIHVKNQRLLMSYGGGAISAVTDFSWGGAASSLYSSGTIPLGIEIVMRDPLIAMQGWVKPGRSGGAPYDYGYSSGSSWGGQAYQPERGVNLGSCYYRSGTGIGLLSFTGGPYKYAVQVIARYSYNGTNYEHTLNLPSGSNTVYEAASAFSVFQTAYSSSHQIQVTVEPVPLPIVDGQMYPMTNSIYVGWSKPVSYGFIKPYPVKPLGFELNAIYTNGTTLYVEPVAGYNSGATAAFNNIRLQGVDHPVGSFVYTPPGYDDETGQSWEASWSKAGVAALPNRTLIECVIT